MSNTITIYKVTRTKTYMMSEQGTGYSLQPWIGNNVDYEGYDDGGSTYTLPDGYEVAECNDGTLELYDPQGKHVEILDDHGHPAIVTGVWYNKDGKEFAHYLRLDK